MEQKLNDYNYIDGNGEHLHTLRGQPLIGTSSVADVLKKDGLTYWASGLAVAVFGATDGKVLTKIKNGKASEEEKEAMENSAIEVLNQIKEMNLDDYILMLHKAYGAHAVKLKDSAQQGTDLHAELERFVKYCMKSKDILTATMFALEGDQEGNMTMFDKKISPFIFWTRENVKRFLWSEIHAYSEVLWTGGISDCGYEKNDGTIGVMDFKSSKDAYDSQFFQCAGYTIEIEENGGFDKDGNKVFELDGKKITELAVFPFGMENPEPKFYSKGVDIAKESFVAEVTLYKNMYFEKK